jgi:hypothetical protein
MKLNESNHETSKQIHVCPYCLQDVPEGSICPCITEGDPEAFTVKTRIEALTLHSRERVLEMIELCESRELREAKEKVEPEALTDRTTPPTTNSPEAVTDNSLSDDDKAWADAFIRLKYGILRLENLCNDGGRAEDERCRGCVPLLILQNLDNIFYRAIKLKANALNDCKC